MPLFEYKCDDKKCEHKFEKLMRHDERDKIPTCPKCGGDSSTKLISRTSFALKGGGWASDGYGG